MFTWDLRKDLRNRKKHGVSFLEAATVFEDPNGLEWADLEHSSDEVRLKRLGLSVAGRVLILVYTARKNKDGKETHRIISARRPSQREGQAYRG